ncbi:hypothetical protein NDU88_002760 [Pleurodeles waltl]|uniref:Uncharacterized protein n=1 Tax=Pleurodeles waltl TaxID=8319 RepID=A0AAV7LGH3_PLEWA|nr:hypothetical protein NDU88_002760 [Pleurodeles waltl]
MPQTPIVQAGNISLQGLTAQQLNEWLDKLNSPQTTPTTAERSEREEYLNFVSLDFEPKDFEHMRTTGMKAHLKEILQIAQVWGALEKWEDRWVKKRDKRKSDSLEQQAKAVPDTGTIKMLPIREMAGGVLVHVPWTRGDILSSTNDFPRMGEKQIEWSQQTDRFVKLAKCLWEDLNTLFEIIVPTDLWLECKRSVDFPAAEPARNRVTGAPSPEVMKYYYKVIEFLKQSYSVQNIDWQKIDRTAQEAKESIHAYYERLLKAFKHYSGTEAIEAEDMNHLVFRFVEGLRPEISQMIKNHLICWQAKPIVEVLQYAKYCSDEIELKEKVMVMQIKAAQSGMQ